MGLSPDAQRFYDTWVNEMGSDEPFIDAANSLNDDGYVIETTFRFLNDTSMRHQQDTLEEVLRYCGYTGGHIICSGYPVKNEGYMYLFCNADNMPNDPQRLVERFFR